MCSVLHHVEICVGEEKNVINLLIRGFGFTLIARHLTPQSSKWALKHGSAVFVITKRRKNHKHHNRVTDHPNGHCDEGKNPVNGHAHLSSEFPLILGNDNANDLEHWTVFCCQDQASHATDSAFNVALVVKDVDEVTKRVKTQGGRVLREPTIVEDSDGQVRYSIVKSCFGNVVHTLIDKQDYSGEFLPGFERLEIDYESYILNSKRKADECLSNNDSPYVEESTVLSEFLQQAMTNHSDFWSNDKLNGEPLFTHVDHIAFACEAGKSKELMAWYENCFGMKRFATSRKETEEGLVLDENIGMRLKAMEYWKCAEVGLTVPPAAQGDSLLKVVIGEPLVGFKNSQINTFLKNHQGPGLQHIALHTPHMAPTVKHVSQQGVTFRKAPPAYYQKGIRLEDIKAVGHGDELDLFQELGILLDTEDDVFCAMKDPQEKAKYLLQVFTTAIFEEDTFFLEVIHRKGAEGFGAGNIRALAQSIIYDQQQQKQALKQSP